MSRPTKNDLIACHAMASYIYNTSGFRFARDIFFEDSHPDYLKEKMDLWVKSPVRAIGHLDKENFRKLCRIAFERYGDASERFISY